MDEGPQAGGLISWQLLLLPLMVAGVFVSMTYAFQWFGRWNCDSLGGSYSIQDDGIFEISTCQVTTQNISSQTMVSIENECFINHVKTNCSELGPAWKDFRTGENRYEINGVCPGVDDNRTMKDCINEIEADMKEEEGK